MLLFLLESIGELAIYIAEVCGVNFSDSYFTSVWIFLIPDPEIFQISESDSCSDSSFHLSNRKFPMFLLEKWPRSLVLLSKLKIDSEYVFSQVFDSRSGSERKTQNPFGVDSGTPDPWLPLWYIVNRCIDNSHKPKQAFGFIWRMTATLSKMIRSTLKQCQGKDSDSAPGSFHHSSTNRWNRSN